MNKKLLYIILAVITVIILYIVFRKPETPEEKIVRIEKVRREAYDFAVKCGKVKTPKLRYEDIIWVVMPGRVMNYKATDGSIDLLGFFSQNDSTIYVPEWKESTFWVLAHESMHAIGHIYPYEVGDKGHPDFPFRECNLRADQH